MAVSAHVPAAALDLERACATTQIEEYSEATTIEAPLIRHCLLFEAFWARSSSNCCSRFRSFWEVDASSLSSLELGDSCARRGELVGCVVHQHGCVQRPVRRADYPSGGT